MKKKHLSILFGLMATSITALSVIAANKINLEVSGETYIFTMSLNKDNQIQFLNSVNTDNYSIGEVKTDMGTNIRVAYSMDLNISPFDSFAVMKEDEYFELCVPVNGLTKLEYEVSESLSIALGYERGEYKDTFTLSKTESKPHTIFIEDWMSSYGVPPSHFKIYSENSVNVTIKSLKFYYTCATYPDPTKVVGTWDIEPNEDSFYTITGFHIDQEDISENHILVVPSMVDGQIITRISEGVLSNVPWVEHVVLPFVGENIFIEQEGFSYNFASIFGKNDAHNKYQPIQQYEGTTVNIWYVPKSLHKITIIGGNHKKDPSEITYNHIPAYAFYGCGSLLRSITITGQINEIDKFAFTNCSTMEEIILPEEMQIINEGAFTGCNKLFIRSLSKEITMDESANPNYRPISLGYKETFLKDGIYYDICTNSDDNEYLSVIGIDKNMNVVNVPSSVNHHDKDYNVKRIANRAFNDQTQLRAVHFSNGLEKVGQYLFQNCYRASVYLNEDPSESDIYSEHWSVGLGGEVYFVYKSYHSEGLHYYDMSGATYIIGVDGELDEQITIDANEFVNTVFPHYAFDHDVRISTLTISKTTVFKPYSFANCIHLSTIGFLGTSDEFIAFKNEGKIGFNSFINCATNQVLCTDGIYVAID